MDSTTGRTELEPPSPSGLSDGGGRCGALLVAREGRYSPSRHLRGVRDRAAGREGGLLAEAMAPAASPRTGAGIVAASDLTWELPPELDAKVHAGLAQMRQQ